MSRRVQIRHHRGLEPCTETETPASETQTSEDADSSPAYRYTGTGWEADDSFIRGRLEEGVPAFVSEGLANEGIRNFTIQVGPEISRPTFQYLPPTPGPDSRASVSRNPYHALGRMRFDIEYDIRQHRYILGCTLEHITHHLELDDSLADSAYQDSLRAMVQDAMLRVGMRVLSTYMTNHVIPECIPDILGAIRRR